MWKRACITVALSAVFCSCQTCAQARLIEDWPYEKLFRIADIVVIARVDKTEPSQDASPTNSFAEIELVGQNTTFKINHVLKGKLDDEQITMLHFKIGKSPTAIINGPLLARFDTKESSSAEFMLFLRRLKDGATKPFQGKSIQYCLFDG